jgi:DNA-binding transcriptional LysR family regulator
VRKPKGFRLTPEGGLFYAVCRKVLRLEAEMFRRLQQTRDAAPGIIRLATRSAALPAFDVCAITRV